MLAIEVSGTSLVFDIDVRTTLYARAGIPEYWVADLTARRVLQHRDSRDGHSSVVDVFTVGDQITSLTDPPIPIAVADVFD